MLGVGEIRTTSYIIYAAIIFITPCPIGEPTQEILRQYIAQHKYELYLI